MREIIVGRLKNEIEKYGKRGCILLGKQYVRMGQTTSLASNIYLDIANAHVVFICGKRGGGKSYTMGVIAEGMTELEPEIKQNLSFILLDTMGIYWTMKYPNHQDEELLKQWNLEGKSVDIKIYTPAGFHNMYKKQGIPTDAPFSIKPAELNADDWCKIFNLSPLEPVGIVLSTVIDELRDESFSYSMKDIIEKINDFDDTNKVTKDAAINLLKSTKNWGLFSSQGTSLKELAVGGQVTVLDVSCYATMPNGWNIKSLVIGLISQKLFLERMKSRKDEEYSQVNYAEHYFSESLEQKLKFPLVWLVIDEAHEFLPSKGETLASQPLITILREGRQPGISLILATQQPGKIHSDVLTQSDTVISHRITARLDTEALGLLTQSYMKEGLVDAVDRLPRVKGAGVLFDDSNERIYPFRVRPRFTWHGGSSPTALRNKIDYFKDLKIEKNN
jgi:energy-coupling factor transporter ATP-binding protein EcfA2